MFFQLASPNLDVLQNPDSLWSLSNIPLMESYLSVMDEDPIQDIIKAVIDQYKTHVQPKTSSFQKGNTAYKSTLLMCLILLVFYENHLWCYLLLRDLLDKAAVYRNLHDIFFVISPK